MQFIYTTKHVSTPEEYIDALLQGYRAIELPKPQHPALLTLLCERWQEDRLLAAGYAHLLVIEGGAKNFRQAFEIVQPLMEEGFLPAFTILAWLYLNGEGGVSECRRKAAKLYRIAAKQGYAPAQLQLGNCYQWRIALPRSDEKAALWYQKAAEQDLAEAQLRLGFCYGNGEGVPQSYEKAVELYEKAAAQGNLEAQLNLGFSYARGDGVPASDEKAANWYQKAAEQGHARAQYYLALCYKEGKGVPQSMEDAVKWLTESAEQGDFYAKMLLRNLK